MVEFERQFDDGRSQVAALQAEIARIKCQITATANAPVVDTEETATIQQAEALVTRLAELLMDLDAVADHLSDDFSMICRPSRWERAVGLVSKRAAQFFYTARLQETFLEDALAELIAQSDNMAALLQGHLEAVQGQIRDLAAYRDQVDRSGAALEAEHQAVRRHVEATDRAVVELENKRVVRQSDTDQSALTQELDAKRQELAHLETQSAQMGEERAAMAQSSASAARWEILLKTHADTQRVLIRKLEADIRHRSVLSEAFFQASGRDGTRSDDVMVSDIGADTLAEYYPLDLGKPAAPVSARMGDMLGAYGDPDLFAKIVHDQKDRTDAVFNEHIAHMMKAKQPAVVES